MPHPESRTEPRAVTMLALFAMAWTMGVVDSFGYDNFGVFTTNQAGNLVVFGKAPWEDWPHARLAGLSLLGAVIGVVVGTAVSRSAARWSGADLAVPVTLGTLLLVVSASLTIDNARPPWLVPVMAAGTACMAAGWVRATSVKLWLTANTGGFLAAVRAVVFTDTASESPPEAPTRHRRRFTTTASISAGVLTVGFVSGVVAYGLGVLDWPHPVLFAVVPAAVVSALALRDEFRRTGLIHMSQD